MSERPVKPCPFCGYEPVVTVKKDESLVSHDIVNWTTVRCTGCDIAIRTCEGYGDAIDEWNERDDTRAEQAEASLEEMRALLSQVAGQLQASAHADRDTLLALERAERAEAALSAAHEAHARHAADRSREVTELHRAHERALRRAEQAEAEVARLREERDGIRAAVREVAAQRDAFQAAYQDMGNRVLEAEAEVARLRNLWNAEVEHANRWARRAREAEAEVARLRAQADDVSIHAAGRLAREAREAALREAAGVCEAAMREHAFGWGPWAFEAVKVCMKRILSLLDAAPAAEVEP